MRACRRPKGAENSARQLSPICSGQASVQVPVVTTLPAGSDRATLTRIAELSKGTVRDTLAGLFDERLAPGTDILFSCGAGAPSGALIIPTLRAYIVLNSATLTRVSNGLALPLRDISISGDADSVHWTWSATLPLRALRRWSPKNGARGSSAPGTPRAGLTCPNAWATSWPL